MTPEQLDDIDAIGTIEPNKVPLTAHFGRIGQT